MSNENISEQKNTTISIEQAGQMFDTLFLDPEKKELVAQLFKGFPGLIREQKVNNAIQTAKGGLQDLKNNIV
ncbi:hypothetical protein GW819_00955 [Candidatus Gracilibacteria bacterium]|nr:hypothetical protein [Candidatus Gracilibacteria bacterium]